MEMFLNEIYTPFILKQTLSMRKRTKSSWVGEGIVFLVP